MALQFILGNSGNGKTHFIYRKIIKAADGRKDMNFLILVPEQFTMQTQRELVRLHPRHSILNIDVLSFNRLAYRIFDELGSFDSQVLEETGKSLILRRVAQEKSGALTALKKNITKMGYIGEIKSLISELAQYHITPSQLSETIEKLPQGSFSYKLRDVLTMYQGFLDFLEGRFVTAEEVLELLADVAGESEILKNSVIVFDGFTGFTPIQNLLLKKLLPIAKDVYVTAVIDVRENPYHCAGSHELFAMSKKMIKSLQDMANELHVEVKEPVRILDGENSRFSSSPALHFLEQNLFRSQGVRYKLKENDAVFIDSLKNPREEMRHVALEIERLVRENGYCYREIAIVCGNLPLYDNYASEVFSEYRIPLFIDQKTTILFHPFIEFVRAILEVVSSNFSTDSVFRYLRSGFSGISREEADLLENYCLAAGVRGRKKWSEAFCYRPRGYEEGELVPINETREKVWAQFLPLWDALKKKKATVGEQTAALYRFLCERDTEKRLKGKARSYESAGDLKNAKEYDQIYRIVMDLFDKLVDLLGTETIGLEEYAKILDSGFETAKVGVLPTGYDRVVFGDIERTRLDRIRALFFVGVNDGIIPKAGGADGILSQLEREKLSAMNLELAPTMREKMFIQKFYLYLALTKPSERLYLSYARVNGEGKAIRSSYLIRTILKLYDGLLVREINARSFSERILTPEGARGLLIEGIESASEWKRTFMPCGNISEKRYWAALCRWYRQQEEWKKEADKLFFAAQFQYVNAPISPAVAKLLYGSVLENSVTRLEIFSACAFSHFLSYGLGVREREESGFSAVDFGNVFHEVLEAFANGIRETNASWFTITEEECDALLLDAMEQTLGADRNLALYENARSIYAKERMYRILKRTVEALLYQVRKGRFKPDLFEVSFSSAKDLSAVSFQLSEGEKMRLRGRIDRIDTCENKDKLYVKVIDYKSGNTSFQFLNVYYGLQLQLVVYMNAALELMQKRYPSKEAVPAGIFYYHVNDPMIETEEEISDEELREKIFSELKLNGIANADGEILENLDVSLGEGQGANSSVIPVGIGKDGSLKKTSKALSTEEFEKLSAHVNGTILRLGQRILRGDIGVSPYALSGKTGCDYCGYRAVCQFDAKLPGFGYRKLKELSAEELLKEMGGANGPWA